MKISELLNKLEMIMWREGDLDVWTDNGWGADPPNLLLVKDTQHMSEGLYLN